MKNYWVAFLVALAACGVVTLCCIDAADEISVSATLKVDNGFFKYSRAVQNFAVDQTTSLSDMGIESVAANGSTNALTFPNVSTPHYMYLRSLDTSTTNAIFVTLTVRLEAGDIAVLPVSSTTISAYTTNGAASLEYWLNAK